MWARICLAAKDVYIGAAYIPPNSDDDIYDPCVTDVRRIVDLMSPKDNIFLFGDFNLPRHVDWLPDMDNNNLYRTNCQCKFVGDLESLSLAQVCNVKTRRQLDLIFTNADSNFELSVASYALKHDSHHHRSMSLAYHIPVHDDAELNDLFYDFTKADRNGIISFLGDVVWNDELVADEDVERQAHRLNEILLQTINRFVPIRKRRHKYTCKWMTPQLAHLFT